MQEEEIITNTIFFVKKELESAEGGHDWWHIESVWKNARLIAMHEIADNFIVELAALLHDIADAKFHDGNENIGPQKAREFLESLSVNVDVVRYNFLVTVTQ